MTLELLPEIVNPSDGHTKPFQPDSILLLRGPGHNLMRERKSDTANPTALQAVEAKTSKRAEELGLKLFVAVSNVEGYLINHIHAARQYGAIIFSPGALCHYSYALYDALSVVSTPFIEVHVGNMYAKEDFRKSILACLASGYIVGCGPVGYELAVVRAKELIEERKKESAKA